MKRKISVLLALVLINSIIIAEDSIKNKLEIYKVKNFKELNSIPSFSLGSPSGMVGGKNSAFVGISGLADKDDVDGGINFGVGYGNSNKLGGNISLGIGSINPIDGGAFNRGTLNISLGHNFKEQLIGLAMGVNSLNLWHNNENDYDKEPSYYLSATKLIPNEDCPIVITLGIGNNNYAKVSEKFNKKDKMYPFFSGAIYLIPQLSVIGDYTSNILTLGIGVVPFPKLPISITAGVYDVTKERTENKVSFIGSLGIGIKL